MTLPTFGRDKLCPKCGGEASTRYVLRNEWECQTTFAPLWALPEHARPSCHYYNGEHLHRNCRCGYRWAEAVMTLGGTTEVG